MVSIVEKVPYDAVTHSLYDIVVFGEILIDFTAQGYNENGQMLYARNPGGAPANVAVAAGKLGAHTAFIGKAGKDMHGEFLQEVLKKEKVDTIIESNRYTGNMGDSYIRPSGKLNDIYGNEYERGLAIWIARWNAGHEKSWAWVKYNINNEYEYLQSDLVLVPSNNTTNFDTILDFYGDGKLLGSYEFRATDLPIKVAVNVSGVNDLKIYFHDN